MHGELVEKLREKLGAGLEGEIDDIISSFGGLLTRHAAVLLLCRKNGIDVEQKIPLSQASSMRLPFSFEAKITRIFPAQSYAGRPDRSVRVHISDGSWEATLVLWNEQAAGIERGEIRAGDNIACNGAYSRSGEITLARGGGVRKLDSAQAPSLSSLPAGICNAEGVVKAIDPDREYVDRKTGGKKTLSSFAIGDGTVPSMRVAVWAKVKEMEKMAVGDSVFLENVVFKNNELHFNSGSRMALLGKKAGETAVVERIDAGEDETLFVLDGREFRMKNDEAARLVGLPALPGVSTRAAIGIKAQEIVGKRAGFAIEGGRLCSLTF
jgi:hypothetical protein